MASRCRIGLISQWPTVTNGEYELLAKICRVKSHEFQVIDYLGYDIHTGARLDYRNLDFVVAFHYDTARYVDCPTYCAIINPLEYLLRHSDYTTFSSLNYLSHNDHIIAKSATLLRYHLNNMLGRDCNYDQYSEFYPSVSRDDVLPPCEQFPHLFYCGINWERLTDQSGRHDELLSQLDHKNIIKIYGPQVFEGKKLWTGFTNYQGTIPFDGISILKGINQCGISLVLSSEVHFSNETASSRIYESCAAGAIIISDDNPFVVKEFGDTILYLERTGDAFKDASQIETHYQWIQKNPAAAKRIAERAQNIFLEKFTLERVFDQLADDYIVKRDKRRIEEQANLPLVTVALRISTEKTKGIQAVIDSIMRQDYPNCEIIVLCPEKLSDHVQKELQNASCKATLRTYADFNQGRRTCRKGKELDIIISLMKGEYLALIEPGWTWHHDHVSTLYRAMDKNVAMTMGGGFYDVENKAPADATSIVRFCDTFTVADFETNRAFLDMPAFLIKKSVLQQSQQQLLLLFEHYEALLFYIYTLAAGLKTKYAGSITFSRQTNALSAPAASCEDSTFWGKVSSKLDNPGYEIKLIFDHIRYNDQIDPVAKAWIGQRAGHPSSAIMFGNNKGVDYRNGAFTFEDMVKSIRNYSPKQYKVLRFFYRIFKFFMRLVPTGRA